MVGLAKNVLREYKAPLKTLINVVLLFLSW